MRVFFLVVVALSVLGLGGLVETELQPAQGYSALAGQRHRLVGITDCEVFEASLPEGDGTTERLEDDYQRPDETADVRQQPNRGWKAEAGRGALPS